MDEFITLYRVETLSHEGAFHASEINVYDLGHTPPTMMNLPLPLIKLIDSSNYFFFFDSFEALQKSLLIENIPNNGFNVVEVQVPSTYLNIKLFELGFDQILLDSDAYLNLVEAGNHRVRYDLTELVLTDEKYFLTLWANEQENMQLSDIASSDYYDDLCYFLNAYDLNDYCIPLLYVEFKYSKNVYKLLNECMIPKSLSEFTDEELEALKVNAFETKMKTATGTIVLVDILNNEVKRIL